LTPPSTFLSIDASATVGSNGYYTSALPITLLATAGSNPVSNISYYIDSNPVATSSSNPTNLTLIQQGTHVLNYYATDDSGLSESVKNFSYKLDIVAPTNWNKFTLVNSGNSHTFTITVNVTDKTSGLDSSSAEFQYSVDNGSTWGYYSNLEQCNSTWNTDQWKSASISPNQSATTSAQINIPSTDYCNSNWSSTKYIRIRIKDMAGLTSTKQYALMSPWIQTTNADVYSLGDIDMLTEPNPGATGLIISSSNTINNFSSSSGWNLKNYTINNSSFYSSFWSKIGSEAQTIPTNSAIPGSAGVYISNTSMTISNSSLPSGYSNATNLGPIVFVNGDLYIDANMQLDKSSTILWIVSGDVGIKNNVNRVDGMFFVDGEFMSSYNSSSNDQLVINGIVATSTTSPNLSRSLNGTSNITTPAEVINYNPRTLLNNNLISNLKAAPTITWKEIIAR
jgi:hypothetical protein